ncbi:uncharacterized protein BDV17DRAFT_268136 [Aspergillus undulatus]|uniref:uncharacterized protein n=1 Tax=Aspergillus undulatus TaxID=1810928 RepID=UPI003CCD466B
MESDPKPQLQGQGSAASCRYAVDTRRETPTLIRNAPTNRNIFWKIALVRHCLTLTTVRLHGDTLSLPFQLEQ